MTLLQKIESALEHFTNTLPAGSPRKAELRKIQIDLRDFVLLYGDPEIKPQEFEGLTPRKGLKGDDPINLSGEHLHIPLKPLKGSPRTRRWSVCKDGKQRVEDTAPLDTDEGPHPWLRVHKERCIAEQVDLHRDFAKAIAELVKQERTVGDDTAYVAALAEVFRLFNAAMRFHKEK